MLHPQKVGGHTERHACHYLTPIRCPNMAVQAAEECDDEEDNDAELLV